MGGLNYKDWPGRTWTIQSPAKATDVAGTDQLTFELVSDPMHPLKPKIRIKQVTCTHGTLHDASNWTADCTGNGDEILGFTPANEPFRIASLLVSPTPNEKYSLACNLLTKGPGGGTCWTAQDGG